MRALLALLLLLVAVPVHADMTATEKVELKNAHLAGEQLGIVMDRLGKIHAERDAANNTRINAIWQHLNVLLQHVQDGIVRLTGNDPVTGYLCNPSCKTTAFDSDFSNGTYWCTSGCSYEGVKGNLDSLAADVGESAAVRAWAAEASTAITAARTLVLALNSALDYATGLPTPGTTSDATTRHFGALSSTDYSMEHAPFGTGPSTATTGPHGDYVNGIGNLQQAMKFYVEGLESMRIGSDWVTNIETIFSSAQMTAIGRTLIDGAELLSRMRLGVLAFTDTPIDATGCALSQGAFIFRALAHLVDHETGMPFFYERLSTEAFAHLMDAMTTRTTFRAYFVSGWPRLVFTAWRLSDGAVWAGGLEFPINVVNTLRSLHRQMSKPNTTHVAPLC